MGVVFTTSLRQQNSVLRNKKNCIHFENQKFTDIPIVKLNREVLKFARSEAEHHLVPDFNYTAELYRFIQNKIDAQYYLSSDFGFKKFLNDYGVVRTLKAGDEAKLELLSLIKEFQYQRSHVHNIATLAGRIQSNGLSSNSGKGGPGLPQSFCSKLLYVYKPDELIPYDSYVLKSLQLKTSQNVKALDQYYRFANEFRVEYFPEKGDEVMRILEKRDKQFISVTKKLKLNPYKLLSWKLTDKYLWCEEYVRKKNAL